MKNSQNNIDKLISKILSEEINAKSKEIIEEMSGEWTEIDMEEELHGDQSKIDVAEPKGKITAADFKKLRDMDEAESGDEMYEEDAETEEGNAFSGALAKAKEHGDDSFEVDGKKYQVKEEDEKKWIQKTDMKKGALHKKLNIPEDEKIPESKLKALKEIST